MLFQTWVNSFKGSTPIPISKMGGVICWGPPRFPITKAQGHHEQQRNPGQILPKL